MNSHNSIVILCFLLSIGHICWSRVPAASVGKNQIEADDEELIGSLKTQRETDDFDDEVADVKSNVRHAPRSKPTKKSSKVTVDSDEDEDDDDRPNQRVLSRPRPTSHKVQESVRKNVADGKVKPKAVEVDDDDDDDDDDEDEKDVKKHLKDSDEDDDQDDDDEDIDTKGLGDMAEKGCREVLLKGESPEDVCSKKVNHVVDNFGRQCVVGVKSSCNILPTGVDTCKDWVEENLCDKAGKSSFVQDVVKKIRKDTTENCVKKVNELCHKVHELTTNTCKSLVNKICEAAPWDVVRNKCKELMIGPVCT